jgi:hypothetical protein
MFSVMEPVPGPTSTFVRCRLFADRREAGRRMREAADADIYTGSTGRFCP